MWLTVCLNVCLTVRLTVHLTVSRAADFFTKECETLSRHSVHADETAMLNFIIRGGDALCTLGGCDHVVRERCKLTHKSYSVDLRDLAADALNLSVELDDVASLSGSDVALDRLLDLVPLHPHEASLTANEKIGLLKAVVCNHSTSYQLRRAGRERCGSE